MLRSLLKTAPFHNFRQLLTASVVSYLIAAITMPVVSRLYTPEDMGLFATLVAHVAIINAFANFRYDVAIPSARSIGQAFDLVVLSFLACLLLSAAAALALAVSAWQGWFGFDRLPASWPVTVFLLAQVNNSYGTLQTWLIRTSNFPVLSSTTFVNMAARVIGQIGFGTTGFGSGGLIISEALGRIGAIVYALLSEHGIIRRFHGVTAHSLMRTTAETWSYPAFVAPSSLINATAVFLFVPATAIYFGQEAAGHLALVTMALNVPGAVVGKSAGDIYWSHASEAWRNSSDAGHRIFMLTLLGLTLFAVPTYSIIFFMGPQLFTFMFGDKWLASGHIAVFISIPMALEFIASPLTRVFNLANKNKWKLLLDIFFTTQTIFTFIISHAMDLHFYEFLLLFSLSRSIFTVGTIFGCYYISIKYMRPHILKEKIS